MKSDKDIIVNFIFGYYPGENYGGSVTSIHNFTDQLCDKYEMRIVTSNHEFQSNQKYENIQEEWNKVGNAEVYYVSEKNYRVNIFEDILNSFIRKIKFIYLSSIYNIRLNYPAILFARKYNIPVLLAPRGDLMKNSIGMKSKAKMMKKLIFLKACKMFDIFKGIYFQSTSDEETYGIKRYLNINENRIMQNPNLPVAVHERICANEKTKGTLRIVFVSRLMVKKNPLYALEVISKISDSYNILFDIYGPKEDLAYWEDCEKMAAKINQSKNKKVYYRGSLSPQRTKTVYDGYDCFLFPTLSENYGHVIAEAMLSDCPVVLSKGTTPFDDCHGKGNFVVPLAKKEDFVLILEKLAQMDEEEYRSLTRLNQLYIRKKFQIAELRNQYINMIEMICKQKEESH